MAMRNYSTIIEKEGSADVAFCTELAVGSQERPSSQILLISRKWKVTEPATGIEPVTYDLQSNGVQIAGETMIVQRRAQTFADLLE